MSITKDEINEVYMTFRKKNRGNADFHSNINLNSFSNDSILNFKYNDRAMIIIVKDRYITKGYLCFEQVKSLNSLIESINHPFFVFWNTTDVNEKDLDGVNLRLYTIYQRSTVTYEENPYLLPDTNSRRDILRKMYVPNFGEYACVEDAEELNRLSLIMFDKYSDELPDLDEWREICNNKECLLYREDNPEENNPIIAYYVWKLEGKKLYSRMSANRLSANILYNLERRIFTHYFDMGIRTFYGWGDIYNTQAADRRSEAGMVKRGVHAAHSLYCKIWTNSDIIKNKNVRGRKCT